MGEGGMGVFEVRRKSGAGWEVEAKLQWKS